MIKNAFKALGDAARGLFRNRGALLVLSALYAALLAAVYVFFRTGVANAWQLAVSALAVLLAPLLFFVLQAALAHNAQGDVGAGALLRRALRDFLKVLLVGLPLAALAVLCVYLLNKLQAYLPKPSEAAVTVQFMPQVQGPPPVRLRWEDVLLSSLWLLLLGFVLPLLAARLWLSVARDGLKSTLRNAHRVAGSALAPQSVVVYAVGLFVFGLMPYFVIYTITPVASAWAELLLFGLRLALAFVFTLWGWAITLGALARLAPQPAAATAQAAPAEELPQRA
jgi:MFS family permease